MAILFQFYALKFISVADAAVICTCYIKLNFQLSVNFAGINWCVYEIQVFRPQSWLQSWPTSFSMRLFPLFKCSCPSCRSLEFSLLRGRLICTGKRSMKWVTYCEVLNCMFHRPPFLTGSEEFDMNTLVRCLMKILN